MTTLSELQSLLDAATPGPWQLGSDPANIWEPNGGPLVARGEGVQDAANAALICAMHAALPSLLKLARAAQDVHGHGPTGHAPQPNTCPLCVAVAEVEKP